LLAGAVACAITLLAAAAAVACDATLLAATLLAGPGECDAALLAVACDVTLLTVAAACPAPLLTTGRCDDTLLPIAA
jgi:hypothetical protein